MNTSLINTDCHLCIFFFFAACQLDKLVVFKISISIPMERSVVYTGDNYETFSFYDHGQMADSQM